MINKNKYQPCLLFAPIWVRSSRFREISIFGRHLGMLPRGSGCILRWQSCVSTELGKSGCDTVRSYSKLINFMGTKATNMPLKDEYAAGHCAN